MIRIAVAEDDPAYQQLIHDYLKKCETEFEECFQVTYYKDGDDITLNYSSQFDVIFMDIQMRFVDGMTAAREIRKKDSEVIIIFLTSMSQYAVKGYEVDALDYLVKPVDYFSFSQRFLRAVTRINKRKEKFIVITYKGGVAKLSMSDIYYIENQSHNLIFCGNFDTVKAYGTIKEMEEKLAGEGFARPNSGCLVNLKYVDRIQDGMVWIREYRIPLSRTKKSTFMEALTNYVSDSL